MRLVKLEMARHRLEVEVKRRRELEKNVKELQRKLEEERILRLKMALENKVLKMKITT